MEVMINKASSTDAAEILQYLKLIGGETDNLSFGAEGLPFSIEAEEKYLKEIANSCDDVMFVAKVDDKIIGTASLNRLPRRMKHRGEVSVSVLREYWNNGVGKKLLLKIVDFAKENYFEIIDLQVRSDNHPAIHLYEKFGFKKMGTHPVFFKIGNEEISFDYMFLKIK